MKATLVRLAAAAVAGVSRRAPSWPPSGQRCAVRLTAAGSRACPSGSCRSRPAARATAWCPRRRGPRPAAPTRGHADDGAGHPPVGVAEGQRHLRGRQAVVARQRVVAARGRQRLGRPQRCLRIDSKVGDARALGRVRAFGAASRRTCRSAGRRPAANRRAARRSGGASVSSRPLSSARLISAVRVLHRGHARQAVLLGQAHELVHALGRFVRQADVRAPCRP